MDYLTTKQVAEKWGISQRRVAKLCSEGRIEGAKVMGKTWVIPDNTEKPEDKRHKNTEQILETDTEDIEYGC